jgi:cytoskeletal protein CcmA (bactofilin family)
VEGDLKTNSLVISKGGFFDGNVAKLKESEAEAAKPPIQLVKEKHPELDQMDTPPLDTPATVVDT